jgi:serine phosphatase RsbU (regulator of sigma subunit)
MSASAGLPLSTWDPILRHGQRGAAPEPDGGDFVLELHLDSGALIFGVADVAARGREALLQAHLLGTAFAQTARKTARPGALLSALNDVFVGSLKEMRVEPRAQIFVGAIYPGECTLHYASAGLQGAFLFDAPDDYAHLASTGPLVGTEGGWEYTEREIDLRRSGAVVVCSDGVLKTADKNDPDRELGSSGLVQCVQRALKGRGGLTPEAIFEQVDRFNGGRYATDGTIAIVEIV